MHAWVWVHACMGVCAFMLLHDCASALEAEMAITFQHSCLRCLVSLRSLDSAVKCLEDLCDPLVQAWWLLRCTTLDPSRLFAMVRRKQSHAVRSACNWLWVRCIFTTPSDISTDPRQVYV